MKNSSVLKKQIIQLIIFIAITLIIICSGFAGILPESIRNSINDSVKSVLGNIVSAEHGLNFDLSIIIKCLLSLSIVMVVKIIITFAIMKLSSRNKRSKTISSLLNSMLKYICIIVIAIWWLSILGVNTTAILASLGIVGLLLGFGAQSLVEDVITGIFIIFEGHYNVDDIIVLGGFRGTVSEIGIRTTSIVDVGGNVKIVNNSDIRNIQNRSTNISTAICDIGMAYDEKIENAEHVFEEVFPVINEKYKDMIVEGPIYLGVQELADSAVILRVVAKVKENDVFNMQRILNKELKIAFAKNNINIPFPQVVVHSENADKNSLLSAEQLTKLEKFLEQQETKKKELNIQ